VGLGIVMANVNRKPNDIYKELHKSSQGYPIKIPKHGLFMDIGRVTLEQDHFIDPIRALKVFDNYYGFTKPQESLKVIGVKFDRSEGWAQGTVRKVIRGYLRELIKRERGKE
jgi:hypothetical protein